MLKKQIDLKGWSFDLVIAKEESGIIRISNGSRQCSFKEGVLPHDIVDGLEFLGMGRLKSSHWLVEKIEDFSRKEVR